MHDIAIIGAGPYGLSLAAHLAEDHQDFRIFGTPMQTWRSHMPRGMHLKSEGFASTLFDPKASFRLKDYCREQGLPYAAIGLPVPLETFAAYGEAFQKRFVPNLDPRQVAGLVRDGSHFIVTLQDGERIRFRRVVVATGISHYARIAAPLAGLPDHLVSHSAACADPGAFAGRQVIVVGGGASAADCAALLGQAGADTTMITRRAALAFHSPPEKRTLRHRMRRPYSSIGPGYKNLFCTKAPLAFHALPQSLRLDVVRRFLGPAPCWFVREAIERSVRVHTTTQVVFAAEQAGRVVLQAVTPNGPVTFSADHVIAATGYRADLSSLGFLDADILAGLHQVENTPVLDSGFESSVPGLFFVGVNAANSFGPMLRFACGAGFASRRLAGRLRATRKQALLFEKRSKNFRPFGVRVGETLTP
jgi:thioredoxin reductase